MKNITWLVSRFAVIGVLSSASSSSYGQGFKDLSSQQTHKIRCGDIRNSFCAEQYSWEFHDGHGKSLGRRYESDFTVCNNPTRKLASCYEVKYKEDTPVEDRSEKLRLLEHVRLYRQEFDDGVVSMSAKTFDFHEAYVIVKPRQGILITFGFNAVYNNRIEVSNSLGEKWITDNRTTTMYRRGDGKPVYPYVEFSNDSQEPVIFTFKFFNRGSYGSEYPFVKSFLKPRFNSKQGYYELGSNDIPTNKKYINAMAFVRFFK